MADKLIQLMSADGLDNLYPVIMDTGSSLTGIDTSNQIAKYTGNFTYNATGDCWLVGKVWICDGYPRRYISLNGIEIFKLYNADNEASYICLPLKNGDTVVMTGQGGGDIALYIFSCK